MKRKSRVIIECRIQKVSEALKRASYSKLNRYNPMVSKHFNYDSKLIKDLICTSLKTKKASQNEKPFKKYQILIE